jgi:hypothetical protein
MKNKKTLALRDEVNLYAVLACGTLRIATNTGLNTVVGGLRALAFKYNSSVELDEAIDLCGGNYYIGHVTASKGWSGLSIRMWNRGGEYISGGSAPYARKVSKAMLEKTLTGLAAVFPQIREKEEKVNEQ